MFQRISIADQGSNVLTFLNTFRNDNNFPDPWEPLHRKCNIISIFKPKGFVLVDEKKITGIVKTSFRHAKHGTDNNTSARLLPFYCNLKHSLLRFRSYIFLKNNKNQTNSKYIKTIHVFVKYAVSSPTLQLVATLLLFCIDVLHGARYVGLMQQLSCCSA